MRNKKYIIFLALFIVTLGAAAFGYRYLSEHVSTPEQLFETQEETPENKQLDFTITDFNGDKVNFSDFTGKPVVINFWATWCGPCRSELPSFDTLYQKYGDQVDFLMINLTDGNRDTTQTVNEYISEKKYTFPVFYDTQASAAKVFNVYSIPHTAFIRSDGTVEKTYVGAISEETIKTHINKILGVDE